MSPDDTTSSSRQNSYSFFSYGPHETSVDCCVLSFLLGYGASDQCLSVVSRKQTWNCILSSNCLIVKATVSCQTIFNLTIFAIFILVVSVAIILLYSSLELWKGFQYRFLLQWYTYHEKVFFVYRNEDCQLLISAPSGYIVQMEIWTLTLDRCCDYLELFDGRTFIFR